MKNRTYFALTIGPIYDTLRQAKKTRELWSASFLFSWLMKHLYKNLKEEFGKEIEFIIPIVPHKDLENSGTYGEGMFPDWIIAVFSNHVEGLENRWVSVLSTTVKACEETTKLSLKNYIQLYSCHMQVPEGTNPVLEITPVLSQLDLHRKLPDTFPFDSSWWPEKRDTSYKNLYNSELVKAGFKTFQRFKSIPDVALGPYLPELYYTHGHDIDDADIYLAANKQFAKKLKKYHKYIAIVHADGDGIGETLKLLTDLTSIQDFSARLYRFSKEAVNKIHDFGGLPVYAGGDDLLFFAPLAEKKENNPLSLVEFLNELAGDFHTVFTGMQTPPTLSFGVTVTYYKYPLNLALEASRDQLFGLAKSFPGKHVLRMETRLHSSSGFGFYLPLGNRGGWEKSAMNLLKSALLQANEIKGTVTAVRQKSVEFQPVFENIIHHPDRLRNAFENLIGKGSQTNPGEMNFYEDATDLFCQMAADFCIRYHFKTDAEITGLLIQNYFGVLKTMNFLMQRFNDDEN